MKNSFVSAAVIQSCIVFLLALGPVRAEPLKLFMFGNSLVNFHSGSDETTVPHWLAFFAENDDTEIQISGQWGFMRDYARNLPPEPNWSFEAVENAWDSDQESFAEAEFDAILLSPTNFIQYQAPDRPFHGDNPESFSPLSATLTVLDWVHAQNPNTQMFIYKPVS